ncbi:STM3941 family protein [Actinoplanes solisilvae]|uniref:STM3941 family protein n=1 Tax=Actinoplanes solisilvae TaxID=2486853 RepID=UPI000FDAD70F|nr:STM3941 family protein [Actinoplanes solisilvae]
MNFQVRFRPTFSWLRIPAIVLVVAIGAITTVDNTVLRVVIGVPSALALGIFLIPIVFSTICRIPALVVNADGVRLPLMRVHLSWTDIARVRQASDAHGNILLIVPSDPQAVLQQARPWLRAEGRAGIARYGTPIAVMSANLDRTFDEIQEAVARFRPTSQDGGGVR